MSPKRSPIILFFTLILLAAVTIGLLPPAHDLSRVAAAPQRQTAAPPVLLESSPADGAVWNGDPVTLTFDQPLAADSVDFATIEPALDGAFTITDAVLTFAPAAKPEPSQRYRLTLDTRAQSAAGVALSSPVEISLVGATPLQVTSTQPSDGSGDIDTTAEIMVVFNRPVVALVGVDAQADLPDPLQIEPAVEGTGQWLNTSIYIFKPTNGLAGATTYQVTVDAISGLNGETLAAPHTFSFTTVTPQVVETQPLGENLPPDSVVSVHFNQPMDATSTQAAFALVDDADQPVDGEFSWNELHTTLTFTPTTRLDFGGQYAVHIGASAQSANGGATLGQDYMGDQFSIAGLPAVASVMPAAGVTGVDPEQSVVIRFNAPLSPTLVLENISATPLLTTTQVYSYYSEYSNELTLSWFKEANTTYTVTLGSAIGDTYGNTLGQEYVTSFTTGDYAPFVRTSLPQFTHFSAFTQTQVSVLYRNIDSLNVSLFRLPPDEFNKLTGENSYQIWENYELPDRAANRVWDRTYAPRAGRNVTAQEIISVTTPSGELLSPGLYLLELEQPSAPPDTSQQDAQMTIQPLRNIVVLSNRNLVVKSSPYGESLAWLTDLQSGQPVADQPVVFFQNGRTVGQAVTDANGIAATHLEMDAQQAWLPVIAMSGEPGAADFAIASNNWYEGIGPWDYNISSGYGADQYRMLFYTDRPIYRPGQTINWKGIVRGLDVDKYTLPPTDLPINVVVRNDRGDEIFREQVSPNGHGTINGSLTLAPEATTGYYFLEATIELKGNTIYNGVGFQVGAYRKPEFEIAVSANQAEYVQGDAISVTVQADYFSGGPLANAPVTWRILAEPYYFNWTQAPAGRYFSFLPYDPENDNFDPYGNSLFGLLQEGSGNTNADGSFTFQATADLANALQSQRWTFDVTVQSSTNQFVSGSVAAPVHKSQFYAGISPQSYVAQVGEESVVDLVTVTPDGDAYPDAELTLVVQEMQWNSVYQQAADGSFYWQSTAQRTPVYTETVSTGSDGMAQIRWTPSRGGQYQLVARGQDAQGNAVSSAAYLYVSDAQNAFVPWRRDNNDRMELVADRELYAPGDVAHILIPSPFTGPVQALVTLERTGILESRVVTLQGNSETLDVPITAEHIPNIYVSVLLVKGVDATNPFPAMRLGYTKLTVDVAQKELTVHVTPSASELRPGDPISYTVEVQDSSGAPMTNAEVSVALVDKALFTLAADSSPTLVNAFYNEQPLGVTTGALLNINRDRLSQQLTEGAKGGGGGGGGPGILELREEFPDLAFWRADLVTDAEGRVAFSLNLPDNLTTWVLAARAISDDTLVGEAENEVVATKELQIRPLLPRFFTAGDHAQIGATVLNRSDGDLAQVRLHMTIEGADLQGGKPEESFGIVGNGQQNLVWPVAVDATSDQVTVTISAESDAYADAVRVAIPVRRYETPEVVATAGSVPATGVTEAIHLPDAATDNGELEVTLEPSLAAGMIDGLNYLEHYPYECNEQTVSRFLPNLFTLLALRRLNIADEALATELDAQIAVAVQRLTSRQNPDGGWGYWPGEESEPFITSYVLWGLWNANMWAAVQSGPVDFVISDTSLNLAVEYLNSHFQAPKDITERWQLNEMAFTLYVLAEMGQGDPGRASTLYDERARLALYGQAYLALALHDMQESPDAQNTQVNTLLDNLFAQAQLTATGAYWQESETDYRTLNTDTRTTAIVLAAFARIAPDEPLLPNVVRWLMEARKVGHWSTTQENAWSLIALTEWLEASGELKADYDWDATLNGASLGAGQFNQSTLTKPVTLTTAVRDLLRDQANLLQFSRSNDSGQLYYTTHLRYYLDALDVAARDRGIVVDRSFALDGQRVDSAHVGDIISVTVTLVAPTDLYHVLVEAPIPAGAEAIDTRFLNESQAVDDPQSEPIQRPQWFWTPTYVDIRDDKVAFFATFLPAGAYQYTYQMRATVPGEYRVLPVYSEQMYFPEVWGHSAGALFTIEK